MQTIDRCAKITRDGDIFTYQHQTAGGPERYPLQFLARCANSLREHLQEVCEGLTYMEGVLKASTEAGKDIPWRDARGLQVLCWALAGKIHDELDDRHVPSEIFEAIRDGDVAVVAGDLLKAA